MCSSDLSVAENLVPHWHLAPQRLDVVVRVPTDLAVSDVFEVRGDGLAEVEAAYSIPQREVRFAGLDVDNDRPVRLLVLAADASVRATVGAALAEGGPGP